MSTIIKLTYLGVEAQGPTVAKAKQAAAAIAERLMSDPDPLIWHYGGYTIVVWDTPNGAAYAQISPGVSNGRVMNGCFGSRGKEETMLGAQRHIAQVLDDPAALPYGDKAGLVELLERRAWNKAYKQAQAQGADSNAAYDWAWNHWKEFTE